MYRYQIAEEDELAKETGRSPHTKQRNLGEHSITENREGGHFNQREWSEGLNITNTSKKQRVKNVP